MKTTNLQLSAALVLMLGLTTPASAQFGGLKNAIKRTVKNKVENLATDVTNKVTNKVTDKVESKVDDVISGNSSTSSSSSRSSSSSSSSRSSYKKSRNNTPSQAAVAADPRAGETTVEKNYTKSPAQIRAAWESFDTKNFPYQPYYTKENLWLWQPDSIASLYGYSRFCDAMLLPYSDRILVDFVKYDDKVVPYIEASLNAWFAEFLADPESYVGYCRYVRASIVVTEFSQTRVRMKVDKSDRITTNMDDGTTATLFETENDRMSRWRRVRDEAQELAGKVTPFNTIGSAAVNAINRIKKYLSAGKKETALRDMRELDYIMDEMERRSDNTHDDNYKTLVNMAKPYLEQYSTLEDEIKTAKIEANVKPVEMPKGVSVSASLMQTAVAQGKKQWGANLVKTIFRTSNWATYKSPKWPYPITHRSLDVDYIVKENGVYYVNHWVLQNYYLSGKYTNRYSIQAKLSSHHKEKVNYK